MGWNFITPRWPSCYSNQPESVTCECEETGERVRYVPERTCQVESSFLNDFTSMYECWYEFELSCGHLIKSGEKNPPNYCEECGAKVIDYDRD